MISPIRTSSILKAIALGSLTGILLHYWQLSGSIIDDICLAGSDMFMHLIKMLVVPVVFVSLVSGVSSLKNMGALGRMGIRTLCYYLATTALAISLALIIAHFSGIGSQLNLSFHGEVSYAQAQNPLEVLIDIIPTNPFKAMVEGHMLQIIFFAIIFSAAINTTKHQENVMAAFNKANDILMNLVMLCMKTAPLGVFFLLAKAFSQAGFEAMTHMLSYMAVVLCALLIHLLGVYSILLKGIARLSPITFFKKIANCMLFAFSVSSSSASLPLVLKTVREKCGVSNEVASFVIPLGATVNMDGTAIMQGAATVFVANAYGVDIGLMGYLSIISMATLASIGTAGVPGVGLIMLSMVLSQLGLPIDGPALAMIFGVDRLLDMCRTAVNISGDAVVTCCIATHEKAIDRSTWHSEAASS